MGVFTLELHKVLAFSGATLDANGDYVGGDIGLNDYPIWDADYRETLNRKIINRYLNREIGQENPERFVHAMKRRMHEIMPAYNQLYATTVLDLDPTKTIDMRTIVTGTMDSSRESEGSNTTTSSVDAKSRNINSDFPQFQLAENADYATSGTDLNSQNGSTGSGTATETATGKDESLNDSHVTGYQGIPAQLILAARSAIINIDLAIIEELNDLFMIVWDNGDEWLPSNWKGIMP